MGIYRVLSQQQEAVIRFRRQVVAEICHRIPYIRYHHCHPLGIS